MGGNSTPKTRGLSHWLHKQWAATSIGKKLHEADVLKQRRTKPKPRTRKG
jgi:hypothetical protein